MRDKTTETAKVARPGFRKEDDDEEGTSITMKGLKSMEQASNCAPTDQIVFFFLTSVFLVVGKRDTKKSEPIIKKE